MIEQKSTGRSDLLHFKISAPVTEEDYKSVLIPTLDEAIAESDKIRLLFETEAGLSDYTLGAMFDDARLGLKHWRGFDRIAVVTGSSGMSRLVKAFSIIMPCPVQTFAAGELDVARRWLTESLGSIHQTDLGGGALHVALMGQLDSDVFEEEMRDLDAFIRRNDRFRLLLDLREFDGWQGLGAVAEHFRLVRDHAGQVDRAAIVGNAGWQKMAVAIGKRILKGDTRYFEGDQFEAAKAWLTED